MDAVATTQISKLRTMNLKELHEQYQHLFKTPCKSNNREWVFKTVAKKIQGDDEPESAKRPVALSKLIEKHKTIKPSVNRAKSQGLNNPGIAKKAGGRDPRLPKVGSTIERDYKGKTLKVSVTDDGFTYSGKQYRSLSALAKEITGGIINGFAFFRLTEKA